MLFLLVVSLSACAGAERERRGGVTPSYSEIGEASFYGAGFQGKRTASGERFDVKRLTAAHRTLPFGTKLLVTNLRNGKRVWVRVNDRGPYTGGRIVDVSFEAARRLGFIPQGVTLVRIEAY